MAFVPPSLYVEDVKLGKSYTHHSEIPPVLKDDPSAGVVLGVDEAGRGPVLGPMVYAVAYCPLPYDGNLRTIGFDDSKKLTHELRAALLETACDPEGDLFKNMGWAVRIMSPRDISSAMLRPNAYNLNAQAHDATIQLIREVIERGIKVEEIYVDTVGPAPTYQAKLARIFPQCKVTVTKKADSLFPSVSAASICAKVTRDAIIECVSGGEAMGSGYPSDPNTVAWLKGNMDKVFGWGLDTRYSWSTVVDMLKAKGYSATWDEEETGLDMFLQGGEFGSDGLKNENWFGTRVTESDW